MKIFVVTRGYPQQHNKMLGLFERDQALALKNAGHEVAYGVVDIRSIRRKRKFGYNHYTDKDGLEVFEMNWPIGPVPRKLIEYFRQQALLALYRHVLEEFGKPDIVHAHFLNYGIIAVKLCKRESLPFVLTEHSSYMNRSELPWWIKRRAEKTYSACDSIIAVSAPLAANIKRSTGYDSVVVHNIVNVSDNIDLLEKNRNSGQIQFVSAGNLIPRKGFDVLIHAFAKAYKVNQDLSLLILGDGPERKRLTTLADRLGVADRVRFYGRYQKEDLPTICKDASAFVLASKRETFGVVYIEAMALGLPVIATRCGGPEDFVNERNGYLVDVGNIEQLEEALLRMAENRTAFNREEISKFARENFSPEVIAAKITDVYRDVLKKRKIINDENLSLVTGCQRKENSCINIS